MICGTSLSIYIFLYGFSLWFDIIALVCAIIMIKYHKRFSNNCFFQHLIGGILVYYYTRLNNYTFSHNEEFNCTSLYLYGFNCGLMVVLAINSFVQTWFSWFIVIYNIIFHSIFIYRNTDTLIMVYNICFLFIIMLAGLRTEREDYKFFKELNQSRKTLIKFQNFIQEHLPSSLLIMNPKTRNMMFMNKSFSENFKLDDKMDLTDFLKKIRVENVKEESETKKTEGRDDLKNVECLLDVIEIYDKGLSLDSFMSLSCYYDDSNLQKRNFEGKVFNLIWGSQDAYAILLNDISYQQAILSLKIANENQEKAISTLAHELRNPANGLLGITKMLEKSIVDQKSMQMVSVLKTNINLLLNILNSVLDIQQIRANKLSLNITEVNLTELISNIGLLYGFELMSRNFVFHMHVDPALPKTIYTDKSRLNQILINLTANALKFTFQGSITVVAEQDPEDSYKVRFKVIDTGIGIKEEDCKNLFKMFGKLNSSLDLNQEGVGLGLMISNSLVKVLNRGEEKGNQIKVESQYGVGSTFYFSIYQDYNRDHKSMEVINHDDTTMSAYEETKGFLQFPAFTNGLKTLSQVASPIRERSPNASYCESHYAESHQQNVLQLLLAKSKEIIAEDTALIVDDNVFNLYVAQSVLSSLKFKCYFAQNGQEAIKKFEELIQENIHIDIIFMDFDMPILNGFQAAAILKQKMRDKEIGDIPIIGFSANEINEIREEDKNNEMDDYLCKPITEDAIKNILRKHLKRYIN